MIAGEASGDIYGADLARHLFKKVPLKISGVGGKRMKDAGIDILFDSSEVSVIGLFEILPRLKAIRRAYRIIRDFIISRKLDLIILIDFPGFNIRIAGLAKKAGIPVVYYISPQIWASRKSRLRLLRNRVKKMIVILPFEEAIYKEAGIDCSFIGHPLVDEILSVRPLEETIKRYDLNINNPVIGLLPGSRIGEIRSLLFDILDAAYILKKDNPKIQFIMAVADSLDYNLIDGIISGWRISKKGDANHMEVKLVWGEANDVLNVSNVVIAASGTITLQAALLEKPMVILYRLSTLTYLVARLIVKVKDIGLVNILAGRRIVPELIQKDVTPEKIAGEVTKILYDRIYYNRIKNELHEVRLKLGPPGTSERVAKVIAGML